MRFEATQITFLQGSEWEAEQVRFLADRLETSGSWTCQSEFPSTDCEFGSGYMLDLTSFGWGIWAQLLQAHFDQPAVATPCLDTPHELLMQEPNGAEHLTEPTTRNCTACIACREFMAAQSWTSRTRLRRSLFMLRRRVRVGLKRKKRKESANRQSFQSNVFSQTKCKQKADSDSVMAASVQGQVTIEGIALSCAAVMSSKMKSLVK